MGIIRTVSILNIHALRLLLILPASILAQTFYCDPSNTVDINNATNGTIRTVYQGSSTYAANQLCKWVINTNSVNARVHLKVRQTSLEWAPSRAICTGYDYMEIFNGPTENSRRLALWCGNENPRSLTSNSPSVYVMFQSNDRENYAGITLDFEVFDMSPPSGACPPDWTEGPSGSPYCYMMHDHPEKYFTAQDYCNYEFANLVKMDNGSDADFIYNTFLQPLGTTELVWTGLNDIRVDGVYQWLDGTEVTFSRWPAGHMAEDPLNCVAVRASDGVWFEQECAADVEFSTVQYKFICRRNKVDPNHIYIIPSGRLTREGEGNLPSKWIILAAVAGGLIVIAAIGVMAYKYCPNRNQQDPSEQAMASTEARDLTSQTPPPSYEEAAPLPGAKSTGTRLPSYEESLRS